MNHAVRIRQRATTGSLVLHGVKLNIETSGDPMNFLLNFLVICGLMAVGSAFIVLLPTVGQTLSAVWGTVVGEKLYSHFKGVESGTVMDDHSTPL
jgi:hypothetical protein